MLLNRIEPPGLGFREAFGGLGCRAWGPEELHVRSFSVLEILQHFQGNKTLTLQVYK